MISGRPGADRVCAAPTIEELAGEFAGKVRIGKMNTDENNVTPTQYNIQGIPTVILFKDGKAVDRQVGLVPKDKLVSLLNNHADKNAKLA